MMSLRASLDDGVQVNVDLYSGESRDKHEYRMEERLIDQAGAAG